MIRIQLFTSLLGKEVFRDNQIFYAWKNKVGTAQIPFFVCKDHVEDMGDGLFRVKDLSSVKFEEGVE